MGDGFALPPEGPPLQVSGVAQALQSDLELGITADDPVELDRRRLHFGANVFPQKEGKSIFVSHSSRADSKVLSRSLLSWRARPRWS